VLDLPGHPVLDKARLIGGCSRLPLQFDAAQWRREVDALDQALWGSRGGRVGVHRVAEAIFLRGYAPAQGEQPIEDRPPLAQLPSIRDFIRTGVAAPPQRALLARLPPLAVVAAHVDRAPYFSKTIRIHLPIETHEQAWMVAGDLAYRMRAGEVWALNNSAMHAVWNASETAPRTHLICDFLLSEALAALLAAADRDRGEPRPDVLRDLAATVNRRVPGGAG
jgi:hypothetical protein